MVIDFDLLTFISFNNFFILRVLQFLLVLDWQLLALLVGTNFNIRFQFYF